ncbi:MAG TPA: major capsid protein [Bacteroidia bacterium]|nr:major capsid protein [Bacteroidia bacterium]
MALIPITDAAGVYTKKVLDVYKQRSTPTAFLRSFFPDAISPTKELSIEVQRGFEKIAVDVTRGTDGNRNNFSYSTEKIFLPPYFREFFDATQLQLYDRLFSQSAVDSTLLAAFIDSIVDKQVIIKNLIERSLELQCAQVLTSGIVQLKKGTNIDFKRKAASLVDFLAGNYWANAGVNPFDQIETGCKFLRTEGKAEGGVFNCILGDQALADLTKNTEFKSRQALFNMALDLVLPPQRTSVGSVFHGQVTCGSWRVNLWSYPQYYTLADGVTQVSYLDSKKIILIPEQPHYKMGFATCPQIITPGQTPVVTDFMFGEYIDQRAKAHIFDVESAAVAIPTAVDTIWTAKVCA